MTNQHIYAKLRVDFKKEIDFNNEKRMKMAKLAKRRSKSQITGADTVVTFMEYFVTIMCMAIVTLVPLYMKNAFLLT